MSEEYLQVRIHGSVELPTLIYFPGLHGDWTLAASFRNQFAGKVRFVEITYPQTTKWSLQEYGGAIVQALESKLIVSGWLLGDTMGLRGTSIEAQLSGIERT